MSKTGTNPSKLECSSTRNKTILYMMIPIVLLAILAAWPLLTGLSLFSPNTNAKCCKSGVHLNVRNGFYITVFDASGTLENENASYYVSAIELMFITMDMDTAQYIAAHEDWNATINSTNWVSYFGFEFLYLFNLSTANDLSTEPYSNKTHFDGTNSTVCKSPAFVLVGILMEILRDDEHEFETFDTGFVNLDDFNNLREIILGDYAIYNCTQTFIDLDIYGVSYNQTAGEYHNLYANVNGEDMIIPQQDIFMS